MESSETYRDGPLEIQQEAHDDSVTLAFSGKSILRDPAEFVLPILLGAMKQAFDQEKRLVLDFRHLSYMNSSTFTPIIKVLEKARVGSGSVSVLYDKRLKWQDVSFTALTIFATSDGRIQIRGAE